MPLTRHVRMYCCKYKLSSMTTARWWKSGVHFVLLGMLTILQLQASPCLSQSQMCCSQSMCRPCEQQPWAAARHSALLTDMTALLLHAESPNFKMTHTLSLTCRHTHTVICTQMYAQMHMQWCKWDFSLGVTLEHEYNHLFVTDRALLRSTSFLFFLIYFYNHGRIFLYMLRLFIQSMQPIWFTWAIKEI